MLNPQMVRRHAAHGYEGVRQIEAHVTNTLGWSATTGQVAPWVYQQITETFVLDDRDARAAGRSQSQRPRRVSPTACWKPMSATTGNRTESDARSAASGRRGAGRSARRREREARPLQPKERSAYAMSDT